MDESSRSIRIERAVESDVPQILSFIRQLAEYEKLLHEVEATEERIRQSLFVDKAAEVVIAYLGELQASERSGWAELGRHLSGADVKKRPEPSLFDPPPIPPPQHGEQVLVRLSGVRLEELRDFGDVWLAWGLWRLLELDVLFERLIERGREDVSWSMVAAILAIARFCEPDSELHIEDTWYRRTALQELLGVPFSKVHTDRLYAGLDAILPHKEAIEKHLRGRLGELFKLNCDLLL